MARRVILVSGPPCAGKSTYVAERAAPGDRVLDQDVLGFFQFGKALADVIAMTDGTAWVIRCLPGPANRDAFARRIGATERVHLLAPEAELTKRAAHRPDRLRHIQAVRTWFHREAAEQPAAPFAPAHDW